MPSYNNSYYPATYQSPVGYPQYAQAAMPQVQIPQASYMSQQQGNNGLIWVQGEVGAKAYPVPPNSSLLLMDSENSRFYIKSTDASGMPMKLRSFTYTEDVEPQASYSAPVIEEKDYLTRQEFEEWVKNQPSNKSESRKEKGNGEQRV